MGDPREFHAVAVDARGPKFDGGIVTRLGQRAVRDRRQQRGKRFYDEGEDFWPKRYAIWGGLIARQPDQIAYSIIDSKASTIHAVGLPAGRGGLVAELAAQVGSTRRRCAAVSRVQPLDPAGHVRPGSLDDCRTDGLTRRRATGRADREAAVLRLPAAARHHLHLSGRDGERAGAGHHARRSAVEQMSSPPARSWPAISSAGATWPALA